MFLLSFYHILDRKLLCPCSLIICRIINKRGISGLSLALSIGFILLTAEAKSQEENRNQTSINKLIVNVDQGMQTIDRNIYGHFAEHLGRCIYDGIWVGEDSPIPNIRGFRMDIIEALREIEIPVIRWPGGCFAETYHWKDGIGPRDERPATVNIIWGSVTENNHFGTHEFLDFCDLTGAEPLICGNIGSSIVQELAEWVDYVNSDSVSPMATLRRANGRMKPWNVKYWDIGNENWNCGGNMLPEYYANLFRQFATQVRNFGEDKVYRIACGPSGDDYEWMEVMMRTASNMMEGIDMHYNTSYRPAIHGGNQLSTSATEFGEAEWFMILKLAMFMDELILNHSAIMDIYDPQKRIGLCVHEWGTWYQVEPGTEQIFLYMQSTLRDALVAGLTLNIFNNHCDRVRMANISQLVNVLQSLILTEGEKMLLTPTYHVFEMYKVHQNATLLPTDLQCNDYQLGDEKIPVLSASASEDKYGKIHISICNMDPENAAPLDCELPGISVKKVSGRLLTAPAINSHNTFNNPEVVHPIAFQEASISGNRITTMIPAKSVVMLEIE